LIRKWAKIYFNYIFRGRFWLDLISIIPFELIAYGLENDSKINLRFFKMLKMVWLLRMSKIINYMKTNSSVKFGLHILQIMMFLFFSYHWIGTIWFFIVSRNESWIPPKNLGFIIDLSFFGQSTIYQYILSIYYAALTTFGTDLYFTTDLEMYMAILIVLAGIIF